MSCGMGAEPRREEGKWGQKWNSMCLFERNQSQDDLRRSKIKMLFRRKDRQTDC